MQNIERNKGVLIARLAALSDVAITIPAVYGACRANPDIPFVFVTEAHNSRVFIDAPSNLRVAGIDPDQYKGIPGMRRLCKKLRADHGVSRFVDLQDDMRTRIMRLDMMAAGVKVTHIDNGRSDKRALTRANNKILLPLKPTIERYFDTFRRAGIDVSRDFTSVFPDGKGNPSLFASVSEPPAPGETWIAVSPFARYRGKVYPLDLMKEVVGAIASEPGRRIFIFGFGEEETAKIDELAGALPDVVNMARASIGIHGEMALLSHCRVMLTMDSANQHMAALAGIRVVSVWGATHPYCGFFGWRQNEDDCIQLDMVCRPCSIFGDKPCLRGDYHCLAGISPQMIISKINEIAGYGVSRYSL